MYIYVQCQIWRAGCHFKHNPFYGKHKYTPHGGPLSRRGRHGAKPKNTLRKHKNIYLWESWLNPPIKDKLLNACPVWCFSFFFKNCLQSAESSAECTPGSVVFLTMSTECPPRRVVFLTNVNRVPSWQCSFLDKCWLRRALCWKFWTLRTVNKYPPPKKIHIFRGVSFVGGLSQDSLKYVFFWTYFVNWSGFPAGCNCCTASAHCKRRRTSATRFNQSK